MKSINHILLIALVSFTGILLSCINREYPVTQDYTATENRTEYITESYTENETYFSVSSGEYELPSVTSWGISNFFYYGYDIPDADIYDNVSLKIVVWKPPQFEKETIRVFDVTKTDHLAYPEPALQGEDITAQNTINTIITGSASNRWLTAANAWIYQSKFLGARSNLWSNQDNPQTIELDAGKARKIAVLVSGPENKWNANINLYIHWTIYSPVYGPVNKERTVQKQVPTEVVKQRTYYEIKPVPIWETILPPY